MSCPIFGSNGKFQGFTGMRRQTGKGGIRQKQIMRIFQCHIILTNVKMMCRNTGKHFSCRYHIIRNDHKFHIRTKLFHFSHSMNPVFLINKQFRASGIFPATHIDNTKIFPAVLIGVVFRLHFKPLLNLRKVGKKIGLVLHVAINEGIVLHMMNFFIPTRNIAAMFHVMFRISNIEPRFNIVIYPESFLLFLRNLMSQKKEKYVGHC